MIIEFVGAPGSGKTTLANQLVAQLQTAQINVCTRSDAATTGASKFQKMAQYIQAVRRHPRYAIISLWLVLTQKPLGRWRTTTAILQTLSQRAATDDAQNCEIAVLDEGLVHRGFSTLLGYNANPISLDLVKRYWRSVPQPDVLVILICSEQTAFERLYKRGVPDRMQGLARDRCDAIVRNTLTAITLLKEHLTTSASTLQTIELNVENLDTASAELQQTILKMLQVHTKVAYE